MKFRGLHPLPVLTWLIPSQRSLEQRGGLLGGLDRLGALSDGTKVLRLHAEPDGLRELRALGAAVIRTSRSTSARARRVPVTRRVPVAVPPRPGTASPRARR